jgi:hypothetical protein
MSMIEYEENNNQFINKFDDYNKIRSYLLSLRSSITQQREMADNFFKNKSDKVQEYLRMISENIHENQDIRIQAITLIKRLYNKLPESYLIYKYEDVEFQEDNDYLALPNDIHKEDENILIDSLAYIDKKYSEDIRIKDEACRLIEEEMKNSSISNNILSKEITINSSILQAELDRIEKNKKLNAFKTHIEKNHEMPPPNKYQDEFEWSKLHNSLNISLQEYNINNFNLDLLIKYGPNCWKKYLNKYENLVSQLRKEKENIEKKNEIINQERKFKQVKNIKLAGIYGKFKFI